MKIRKCCFLFLLVCCGCLLGCNGNKSDAEKSSKLQPAEDSAKQVTDKYAAGLTSLENEKNIPDLLCQGWQLEEDLETLSSSDAKGILPFRSFYLFNDSTFIRNPRNSLTYGKWQFNNAEKLIILNENDGNKTIYKIGALAVKELVVINKGEGSITKFKFVSSGKQYKDKNADPFYLANNMWRIAPKKPETDEQIRKRLKEFVWFNILFYRDNLASGSKTISFYGFPTCLRWYAGGIFLTKEKDLASNWFACFYNQAQAMKAYKMMDEVISKKYKWEKSRVNWVIKNLDVLEQMYKQI